MFFPYNTDAPIYYWPAITVSMIVVIVAVFVLEMVKPGIVELYSLQIGDGLHPIQWVTHNFLHADFFHLLGNMLALWTFGLIVEGKLGPWKTLAVFLGIGVIHGLFVQVIMLGHEPTICLGASAIVFGFMAISLIWAPENNVDCFILLYWRAFYFEVQVQFMVALFVAFEIWTLISSGGALSSEFLHTVGAVIGFAVGITMLKTGLVDCEHWDIFSVWAGRHIMTDAERAKQDAESPAGKKLAEEKEARRQEKLVQQLEKIVEEVRWAINNKKPLPAFHVVKQTMKKHPQWKLPEHDFLLLLNGLSVHQDESVEAMKLYLENYTSKSGVVRMKLANIYLGKNQPRSAKKVLTMLNPRQLDGIQMKYYNSLIAKIKSMDSQDTYEIVDDDYT